MISGILMRRYLGCGVQETLTLVYLDKQEPWTEGWQEARGQVQIRPVVRRLEKRAAAEMFTLFW